jgi:hypothetical protein
MQLSNLTELPMPKNQVNDLITDQEMAFAHLILSGKMTDRRAAEAVGLNPETAAYTKAKPRVRTYMLEHRAAQHEQLEQQETEELRRRNQGRERVLARLWEIADLDPEMTRNSMSAQIKALSMIVAIEGLIPDGKTDRRAGSAQNKSAHPPVQPQMDAAAWPGPDPVRDQKEPGVPDPPPAAEADAPSGFGPASGPGSDSGKSIFAVATSSAPYASVSASAPDNRVPSSIEKKPDTWRLRL